MFPQDTDVGTLYAEAMMVQRPWKLYTNDQVPEKDTPTIVAVLQRVIDWIRTILVPITS